MPPIAYRPNKLIATATRSGSADLSIFRMTNWFIRGVGEHSYLECYAGSLEIGTELPTPTPETLPMEAITGNINMTAGSQAISATGGAGTLFLDELHRGQRLMASNNQIIVVKEVFSDTLFDATQPMGATGSSLTARRMRNLFPLNRKRGSLLTGNALEYDRGTLLAVGSGALYVNGALLSGDSLTATRRAQIALKQDDGTYVVQVLGFTEPAGITAVPGAGITGTTTFTVVDTTDVFTDVTHGLETGSQIKFATGDFKIAGTTVNFSTIYYAIRLTADTYKIADSLGNAVNGVALDITDDVSGSGTGTVLTKAMAEGVRSLRIAKASTKLGTPSYGNPSPKIMVTALTAGQAIHITFPAMDSNADPNDPHDAWRVYASEQGGTTALATANAESGPWFWVRTLSSAEISPAGGTYILEYLDSEINIAPRLITFDNDIPQDAEFVASAAGYPVLCSCQGDPTPARPSGTSPGPTIVPFKPHNIAAAPLIIDSGQRNEVPTSPPETIIGFYLAAGRIYLLTPNSLQIAVFVADPDFPVQIRPFWKSGFSNPYAICFVNSTLYGFTSAGAMRSATEGEPGSEEHEFAGDVEEIMLHWKPENVFVVEDMQNECVCYIHSGFQLNSNGFYDSEIYAFMLRSQTWCRFLITSSTEDRIVSGSASIDGHMEFLAGGRLAGAVWGSRSLRFDTLSGEDVPTQVAWQFSDAGGEQRPKKVKFPLVRAKLTNGYFGLHGAEVDEELDAEIVEAGTSGSKTGSVGLDDSARVKWYPQLDVAVNELMTFSPQIEATWDGVLPKDQIHEIILEVIQQGSRR